MGEAHLDEHESQLILPPPVCEPDPIEQPVVPTERMCWDRLLSVGHSYIPQAVRNGEFVDQLEMFDGDLKKFAVHLSNASTAAGEMNISCDTHLVEHKAPNADRPVLFTLCEDNVKIQNEGMAETKWEILDPSRIDERVFFSCVGVLSKTEIGKIADNCSKPVLEQKSDGSNGLKWVYTVNPYVTSGTLPPGESLNLLLSYVPLFRSKSNTRTFRQLVCIRFTRGHQSGVIFIGAIAKPFLDNRDESLIRPANYIVRDYWDIPRDEIYCGRRLGSGAFGTVFVATIRGLECSVKYWPELACSSDFDVELRVFSTLRDPFLIPFIGALDCRNTNTADEKLPVGFILTKLANQGSLMDYYTEKSYDAGQAPQLALETARGLQYMNHCGVTHRDVKSLNLVVDNGSVRIIDFGSVLFRYTPPNGRVIGTRSWIAPEVMSSTPEYSFATDVFSFGMVLYELAACQCPPLRSDKEIMEGTSPPLPVEFAANYPKYARLYRRCVSPRPYDRPSFDVIVYELCTMRVFAPSVVNFTAVSNKEIDELEKQLFNSEHNCGCESGHDCGNRHA